MTSYRVGIIPTKKEDSTNIVTIKNKLIIIRFAAFFSKRSKVGDVTKEFSTKIADSLLKEYNPSQILVLVEPELANFLDNLNSYGFNTISVNLNDVLRTTTELITLLTSYRVKLKATTNIKLRARAVSYLNIQNYVIDDSVLFVGEDDYQKLGINQDKDLSFEDFITKRKRDAWP